MVVAIPRAGGPAGARGTIGPDHRVPAGRQPRRRGWWAWTPSSRDVAGRGHRAAAAPREGRRARALHDQRGAARGRPRTEAAAGVPGRPPPLTATRPRGAEPLGALHRAGAWLSEPAAPTTSPPSTGPRRSAGRPRAARRTPAHAHDLFAPFTFRAMLASGGVWATQWLSSTSGFDSLPRFSTHDSGESSPATVGVSNGVSLTESNCWWYQGTPPVSSSPNTSTRRCARPSRRAWEAARSGPSRRSPAVRCRGNGSVSVGVTWSSMLSPAPRPVRHQEVVDPPQDGPARSGPSSQKPWQR